jgi:TonB family protein
MKIGTFALVWTLACALTSVAMAQPTEYYPDHALRACAGGRAKIHCTVTADGNLTACSVVSETPTGWGFGDATLSITRVWKVRPRADGASLAGQAFERTVAWVPPWECGVVWLNHLAQGAYYPANALRAQVEGKTNLQCDAGNDGRLRNCQILSEDPLGYGFGEATVRMFQTGLRMTVTPEIARGKTVITRTVFWKLPASPTPASPSPPPSAP